jgi:hypothetical protein
MDEELKLIMAEVRELEKAYKEKSQQEELLKDKFQIKIEERDKMVDQNVSPRVTLETNVQGAVSQQRAL